MPFFDERVETLPREELQSLQVSKFKAVLGQIYDRNRFYTAKLRAAGIGPDDFQSLDDLVRFPFTTKAELVQAQADDPPFGTNATFSTADYTRFHQTSGTTGVPLRVLDTRESWDWWGRCWGMVLSGAGVTAADVIFFAFSFGPFVGFWSAVEGANNVGAMMVPGGGSDSEQRLHLMRDLGATVLCSTPTYALRLAEVAREAGIDLKEIPIHKTIHAGEPGASIPATKARIEKAWSAKCFDHAGASEVGAHSFECERQPGGTHAIESEFIVEAIDPETGTAVGEGEEGELVITNLGRAGYPVIRYRTGDLVRLNLEACDCGRTFARFEGGVLGRADNMVIVRGVNVFPAAIENLVRQYAEVDEYKVTVYKRREMGELEIDLEVVETADAEGVRQNVERSIRNSLGLNSTVRVAERGSLPRFELKARRFLIADDAP